MSARDYPFLAGSFAAVLVLFLPLWLRPGSLPWNIGDLYAYHYPLRHLAASTLQEGRLPLWNPYIFAGTPLAANPQAVLFYPLSALHHVLPLPAALRLDAFLHILLAALGAYLLLRKNRLGPAGAWFLSLAYGLSPFVAGRMGQGIPTLLAGLAWVPWVWLAAQSGSPLLLGTTLALQLLSGHPQFCVVNLLGLGLWLCATRPGLLPRLAAGGALAASLAALQVLPTLEFLGLSVRTSWKPDFSVAYSLRPEHLLTLLFPAAFGGPAEPGLKLLPTEFFELASVHIGIAPLLLALCGLRRAGKGAWLLLAAGLFLALGGNNPLYLPLAEASGLGRLRAPARFALLIILGLLIAAAAGWRRLSASRSGVWRCCVGCVAVLDLALRLQPRIRPQDPGPFLSSNPELLRALRLEEMRVATGPDIPAPNKSMLYRVRSVSGYEAFYLEPIARYASRSEGGPAADASRIYIRRWPTQELGRLSARHYVTTEPLKGAEPVLRAGGALLYEDRKALPLVRGTKSWESPTPEKWRIRSQGPGPVVLSQAAYPGWKAWVDGLPVPLSSEDGMFPRIEPGGPGPRTIRFRFLPDSFRVSVWISLGALLWLAGLSSLRLRRWTPGRESP